LVADDPVIFAGSGIHSVTDNSHTVVHATCWARRIVKNSRSGKKLQLSEIVLGILKETLLVVAPVVIGVNGNRDRSVSGHSSSNGGFIVVRRSPVPGGNLSLDS
jgi:hypothetical protein